jgi:hypothetical protein
MGEEEIGGFEEEEIGPALEAALEVPTLEEALSEERTLSLVGFSEAGSVEFTGLAQEARVNEIKTKRRAKGFLSEPSFIANHPAANLTRTQYDKGE